MIVLNPGEALNVAVEPALSSVPAVPLTAVSGYVDHAAPATYAPGNKAAKFTQAADLAAVEAPATGLTRQVKLLTVHNDDATAWPVRVYLDLGASTEYTLVNVTLPALATLVYTDGEGFRVIDSAGGIITTATV
jgi:hypothetical protein